MTTVDVPSAVHIGADELPFVDIGDGSKLKVIQVKETEGLWIVENIFQAGYEVQRHKHTGPGLRLHDLGGVEVQGVRLREPGGLVPLRAGRVGAHAAVHRGRHPRLVPDVRGEPEPRRRRQRRERLRRRRHPRGLLHALRGRGPAPAERPHRADRAATTERPAVDLADPTRSSTAPPHEALAELRRTDPVHWQPMDGEPGFWAVLRHADVVHVARHPEVFSASEGGVVLEDLAPEQLEMMRNMLLAMDPPRHARAPRAAVAALPGPGHRRTRGPHPRHLHGDHGRRPASRATSSSSTRSPPALPSRVIGELMGLPEEDWGLIHELAERNTRGQDPDIAAVDPDQAMNASIDMAMYAIEFAGKRRAEEPPRRTSPRVILDADFGGEPMNDVDFGSFFVQLVTAGNDTTKTMLAVGPAHAARAPRPAGRAARRSVAHPRRGRGDPPVRQPAPLLPAHRRRRHRARRHADRGGRQGGDVLHVGQPRRGRVRRPAALRHPPRTRTRTCPSGSAGTSASACTWPGSRARCSSRSC